MSDYKPISVLPYFFKIIEILLSRIYNFESNRNIYNFESNRNILYDYQFDFFLGRSTVHTLLHFTEMPLKIITMQASIQLGNRSKWEYPVKKEDISYIL